MKKVLAIVVIVMLIISFGYNMVMAVDGGFITSNFSGADPDGDVSNAAGEILGGILAVVRVAGVTTAVVILMVIGIKYLIASAGDRADIKKYAVKYIIGALILFSASGLIGIAQGIISESVKAD